MIPQYKPGRTEKPGISGSPNFFAPNQPLEDIRALSVIQGMGADVYQRIKPLVCTLPMTRQSINVNTRHVAHSVILVALFTPLA
ncbi:hypothetical protein [Yersinia nurmii]|uniref:hypothetical protein n=1 Tax=Yersinia nurmii TaxID=685706 RepID=UPI00338EEF39